MDDEKQSKIDKELEEKAKKGELSLADFTPEKILGIEVKNLIVAPLARKHLSVGDVTSLNRVVDKEAKEIRAIVWNEKAIALDMDGSAKEIVYQPELKPSVEMFFAKAAEREHGLFGEPGDRIWEGDFEAVKFLRRDFLKFMQSHMSAFPVDVAESVKKLKFSEIVASEEILLDEESDNTRKVEDNTRTTNVPTKFSAMMEIAEGFQAQLHFETRVAKVRDGYRADSGQTVIFVRCLNARQVLRDMMEGVIAQLPPEIPRYYGALRYAGSRD